MILSILNRIDTWLLDSAQVISDFCNVWFGLNHWVLARRCLDLSIIAALFAIGLLYKTMHSALFIKIFIVFSVIIGWCYRDWSCRRTLILQQHTRNGGWALRSLEHSDRQTHIVQTTIVIIVVLMPPVTWPGVWITLANVLFVGHYYFKAATDPEGTHLVKPAYQG